PIPVEFVGKTNAQIFADYGIAIGGYVAPISASASNPRINALLGSPTTPATHVELLSPKFAKGNNPYLLSYSYYDPGKPGGDAYSDNAFVKESTPIILKNGWNLLSRTVLIVQISLFVYADTIAQ